MDRDPDNSVARFCYGFKERQYAYGQKVYTQGQIPSEVFVVKSGEVEVYFIRKLDSTLIVILSRNSRKIKFPRSSIHFEKQKTGCREGWYLMFC